MQLSIQGAEIGSLVLLAKPLRDTGTIWMQAGIESLHNKGLVPMNKWLKAWQNVQFLKWYR